MVRLVSVRFDFQLDAIYIYVYVYIYGLSLLVPYSALRSRQDVEMTTTEVTPFLFHLLQY